MLPIRHHVSDLSSRPDKPASLTACSASPSKSGGVGVMGYRWCSGMKQLLHPADPQPYPETCEENLN